MLKSKMSTAERTCLVALGGSAFIKLLYHRYAKESTFLHYTEGVCNSSAAASVRISRSLKGIFFPRIS